MAEEAEGAPSRTAAEEGEAAMQETLVKVAVEGATGLNLRKAAERKGTGARDRRVNRINSFGFCGNF